MRLSAAAVGSAPLKGPRRGRIVPRTPPSPGAAPRDHGPAAVTQRRDRARAKRVTHATVGAPERRSPRCARRSAPASGGEGDQRAPVRRHRQRRRRVARSARRPSPRHQTRPRGRDRHRTSVPCGGRSGGSPVHATIASPPFAIPAANQSLWSDARAGLLRSLGDHHGRAEGAAGDAPRRVDPHTASRCAFCHMTSASPAPTPLPPHGRCSDGAHRPGTSSARSIHRPARVPTRWSRVVRARPAPPTRSVARLRPRSPRPGPRAAPCAPGRNPLCVAVTSCAASAPVVCADRGDDLTREAGRRLASRPHPGHGERRNLGRRRSRRQQGQSEQGKDQGAQCGAHASERLLSGWHRSRRMSVLDCVGSPAMSTPAAIPQEGAVPVESPLVRRLYATREWAETQALLTDDFVGTTSAGNSVARSTSRAPTSGPRRRSTIWRPTIETIVADLEEPTVLYVLDTTRGRARHRGRPDLDVWRRRGSSSLRAGRGSRSPDHRRHRSPLTRSNTIATCTPSTIARCPLGAPTPSSRATGRLRCRNVTVHAPFLHRARRRRATRECDAPARRPDGRAARGGRGDGRSALSAHARKPQGHPPIERIARRPLTPPPCDHV